MNPRRLLLIASVAFTWGAFGLAHFAGDHPNARLCAVLAVLLLVARFVLPPFVAWLHRRLACLVSGPLYRGDRVRESFRDSARRLRQQRRPGR